MKIRNVLPSTRWNRFRLYGKNPNGKYLCVAIWQFFGGSRWSVAIIRHGEIQEDGR